MNDIQDKTVRQMESSWKVDRVYNIAGSSGQTWPILNTSEGPSGLPVVRTFSRTDADGTKARSSFTTIGKVIMVFECSRW